MKLPKPKKVKKTTLKNKLDKLFSLHVRSHGRCELYGIGNIKCSQVLQTMHIVGRANLRLRWDDNNVLCGCSGHHTWYSFHPKEFWEMVEEYFPSKYEYVMKHRNEIVKMTEEKYREMIEEFST